MNQLLRALVRFTLPLLALCFVSLVGADAPLAAPAGGEPDGAAELGGWFDDEEATGAHRGSARRDAEARGPRNERRARGAKARGAKARKARARARRLSRTRSGKLVQRRKVRKHSALSRGRGGKVTVRGAKGRRTAKVQQRRARAGKQGQRRGRPGKARGGRRSARRG